jgi:hypothetical protein
MAFQNLLVDEFLKYLLRLKYQKIVAINWNKKIKNILTKNVILFSIYDLSWNMPFDNAETLTD